jgi:poly(3-hydroxybutyrate) depolymerase
MNVKYNPEAKFEIEVHELPFRRTERGRQLMARVYQPLGAGPFPVLLDLHGGRGTTRIASPTSRWRALAASGVLVALDRPDARARGALPRLGRTRTTACAG